MDLGPFNPVDEGLPILMLLAIAFAFIGNKLIKIDLPYIRLQLHHFIIILICIACILQIKDSIIKIRQHKRLNDLFKDSLKVIYFNLGCFFVFMFSETNVMKNQVKFMLFSWAFIQSKLTVDVMIAHAFDFKIINFRWVTSCFLSIPFMIIGMEKLNMAHPITLNMVVKMYCLASFVCKLNRFRYLFLFNYKEYC